MIVDEAGHIPAGELGRQVGQLRQEPRRERGQRGVTDEEDDPPIVDLGGGDLKDEIAAKQFLVEADGMFRFRHELVREALAASATAGATTIPMTTM